MVSIYDVRLAILRRKGEIVTVEDLAKDLNESTINVCNKFKRLYSFEDLVIKRFSIIDFKRNGIIKHNTGNYRWVAWAKGQGGEKDGRR